MKSLYLVGNYIKTHYKNNKIIFLFFALGVFISALIFIYFYGNFSLTNQLMASDDKVYKTYTLENLSGWDEDSLTWLTQQGFEDIVYVHDSVAEFPQGSDLALRTPELTLRFQPDDEYTAKAALGRGTFTEEEMENGENVVILATDTIPGVILHQEISSQVLDSVILIDGIEFRIVGVHSDNVVIPFKAYQNNNFSLDRVEVTLPNMLTRKENAEWISSMKQEMPQLHIISPYEAYANYFPDENAHLPLVALIFAVSMIGFMFLLKYLLDSSKYEYTVYSILGASKNKVVNLMYAETLLLTCSISLLAIAVHRILYDILFDKINIMSGIRYRWQDYGIILLFICVITMICALPFVMQYTKGSLVSFNQKYK